MATVPVYQGPQVREQALQGGFQRAPDVGSDLQRLGQGLSSVATAIDREALRQDRALADDTDAKITSAWLQWDSENRNKYRGQNVDGYTQAAQDWWKKAAEEYGQDLNPRAKSLASQTLLRKQNSAIGNVMQFVGAEKERHADESAAARISSTIQFGVTTGDTAGAAQQVRQALAEVGARKGWTTEQVQAEQLKNLGALHLAQITKLAEQDPEKAHAYYDLNKAEVPASNQPRVEEVLKGEADNQFATKFAAENASKPLSEQLSEAGKITDPQRRAKTLQQVKLNHAAVREAEAERERQAADQAWQLVGQGRKVPEVLLSQMDGRGRVQLQEHLQARAERLAKQGNTPVKTDPTLLAKVYDLARDNPDEFKKIPLVSLTNGIGGSDLEQIARLQRDLGKPDKEKDVATTTQLLSTYTGGWQPEKRAKFQSAAFDELARFEREKGKPASFEEKRKLLDRLMLDGEVLSGSWYMNDPNKKLYEATPEERKRFAPTITSDDRKLVRAALEAEGVKNPTEAQVLERFKLAKGIK
jgi:hypothetical protein